MHVPAPVVDLLLPLDRPLQSGAEGDAGHTFMSILAAFQHTAADISPALIPPSNGEDGAAQGLPGDLLAVLLNSVSPQAVAAANAPPAAEAVIFGETEAAPATAATDLLAMLATPAPEDAGAVDEVQDDGAGRTTAAAAAAPPATPVLPAEAAFATPAVSEVGDGHAAELAVTPAALATPLPAPHPEPMSAAEHIATAASLAPAAVAAQALAAPDKPAKPDAAPLYAAATPAAAGQATAAAVGQGAPQPASPLTAAQPQIVMPEGAAPRGEAHASIAVEPLPILVAGAPGGDPGFDPLAQAALSSDAARAAPSLQAVSQAAPGLRPPPMPVPVAEQLAVQIAIAAGQGLDRITLKLEPAELGRIDIRLDIRDDGQVVARIAVERPETLDLLQRDSRGLEKALQQAGLEANAGSLSFSLRGDGDDSESAAAGGGSGSTDGDGQDDAGSAAETAARIHLDPNRVLDIRV